MEQNEYNRPEEETSLPENRKSDRRFLKGAVTGAAVVLIAVVCVLGGGKLIRYFITGGSYASGSVSEKDVNDKLDLINALIDRYYLYEDEVDADALVEGIYSGYASALGDPYTEYYDKEEAQALLENTNGEFSGIGATLTQASGDTGVTIVNVYKDSPADKAGLKAGDILYQVDDHEVAGEDLETVVSWVKGETGTEVTLKVRRDGEELTVTAVRDTIEVQTVEYEMKEDNIGYLSVSEFDKVTYDQFSEALDSLEEQGMEGLVIDLRNNPGGNLDTVTDMLRLLLPKGTIVSIKDKDGNTEELTCDGEHEFTKPLAVLVNQYSASASEIFSGAVQDYGTGQIVGVTTYGKGVVQQLTDLGDGTYLKLTIAEYYTPSGRSINGIGVEPDVEVEYKYDENDPAADNQLDRAIEVVRNEME
ncbi:MAG TPA: S41 family peptidase [Candidatus Mediterraneibacter excrementigallinarum]|nr:S41 family peptidase [Candidatus Mediterraneibacter excrementigallinarum]